MQKQWVVAPAIPALEALAFPEIHPTVLQILWNRGIRTQEEMDLFLSPDWSRDVCDPSLFLQMPAAVARVFKALASGEVITVHGDYDADGVCGSTVLMSTLRELIAHGFGGQATPTIFLPHREKDGYGLSVKTVEHLHEHEKTKLIITVDCGISNTEAIARAGELGIDVIVCDHHQMPPELPKAILLHPLVPGETFPNKKLCGTGVAFKLACGLIEEARKKNPEAFPEGYEKWLLDLVAIATVTDVMPILGENRLLEKYGLVVLNKTKRVGLKALLKAAGVEGKPLDTWSIGFQIGPRINAAGRMNHANAAFNLLMCEDPLEAEQLALALNISNQDRQKASEEMYQAAKAQIGDPGERKILFAVGDGWPAGLVGLVAGKLMNDFQKPVFVVGKNEEGKYTGSGRSLHGFDVTAAMKNAAHTLLRFGGHPQACGMSTDTAEKLEAFMQSMSAQAEEYFAHNDGTPTLNIDGDVPLGNVDWQLVESLEKLEPFGEGNPKPLFMRAGLTVVSADSLGADGKHMRLTVKDPASGRNHKFVAFRFGEWVQKLRTGDTIDVAFEVGINEWNGNREIQLRVVDLKLEERG